jgi:hypothetical protein
MVMSCDESWHLTLRECTETPCASLRPRQDGQFGEERVDESVDESASGRSGAEYRESWTEAAGRAGPGLQHALDLRLANHRPGGDQAAQVLAQLFAPGGWPPLVE